VPVLDEKRLARLYKAAKADRWALPLGSFSEALEASAARAFSGRPPSPREVDQYLSSLHLEDLALACACGVGNEAAWELLVREYRPLLYRSADALDTTGGARELADSIYGELYARSLFRYFHGRSSLATWLRSVLAQRYVDRIRSVKRLDPLPDDNEMLARATAPRDPDMARYQALLEQALRDVVARLKSRDRLRLSCYYAQQLTLAETGRLLREHEATVSRQLARTRKVIRRDVEQELRHAGMSDAEVARCVEISSDDAGSLDLDRMFAEAPARKIPDPDRSEGR
jgi:RNA polymerase sigma factor (sigma-70 family)